MGYATIISGGTDGRYVIQVDTGEGLRLSILAALTAKIARLEVRLANAQTKVNEADAVEALHVQAFNAAAEAYIAQYNAPGAPPTSGLLIGVRETLLAARIRHHPFRMALDAIKFDLAAARRFAASMNTVQTLITKPAWCVDFTENSLPGTIVATIDIPGDTNLQLIAPGCRGWNADDGQFISRELLSPPQAYLTAAIFPGWQKFKPTYRWGTLTAINFEANTGSVALFDQKSTAQRLGVNQATTLTDVPIEYMTCGSQPFEIDDRVVVQFVGQDWAQPRLIGFLDNPRPCNWQCFNLQASDYYFRSRIVSIMDAIFGGSVTFEFRFNGSSWAPLVIDPTLPDTSTFIHREHEVFDPFFTFRFIFLTIYRNGVGSFGPCITLNVPPTGPYPPARGDEGRNIVEVRILVFGTLVFNVAARDMGFSGEGVTTGFARSTGGVSLDPGSDLVLPLTYTLTGESP